VRLRTAAAKRCMKVANADGRHLEEAADRGAELPRAPAEVAEGVPYADGIRVKPIEATALEKGCRLSLLPHLLTRPPR
jgi:hypothetical protein